MNITNFRDLGGIKTTNGLHVKEGLFFRSGPIIFKTDEDRKQFNNFNIKTILDLRSPQECEQYPDEVPEGCHYIPYSAINAESEQGGNFDLTSMMRSNNLSQLVPYVLQVYKDLPFGNKAYRVLFDLLKGEDVPIVFHCSAGKDRTGFAAYLILKTLGVSDKDAMTDYLLSNEYRREENEKILAKAGNIPGLDELICVKESHLQSSIDAINTRYPDFETYLFKEYGVTEDDIKIMRNKYLK